MRLMTVRSSESRRALPGQTHVSVQERLMTHQVVTQYERALWWLHSQAAFHFTGEP